MQTTNKALQGQSFLDIVIQETGSIENAIAMAFLNKKSITDSIGIGDTLLRVDVTDNNVVSLFGLNNRPATKWSYTQFIPLPQEGIGYWTIKNDFIVE